MTSLEAKQILFTYRPWVNEPPDEATAQALALCRQDPELARWFEAQCATHAAIRTELRSVPVPVGFREQILSEQKTRTEIVWWRQPALVAMAAVLVLFVALGSIWLSLPREPQADLSLAAFRGRMVRTAVRAYGMDLETTDAGQIRDYLKQHQAPSEFSVPEKLGQAASVGCGVLSWQGQPVTMICYRTGKPLAPGAKSDLFLFVIDRKNLAMAPSGATASFATVSELATATWTEGERVYVLATADESDLRKRL